MTIVKARELIDKDKDELNKRLVDLKQELLNLRIQKVSKGSSAKLSQIRDVRKSIARVLTVISIKTRSELRAKYAGSRYLPKDLRPKKTRAIRRRLSKEDSQRAIRRDYRNMHLSKKRFTLKD